MCVCEFMHNIINYGVSSLESPYHSRIRFGALHFKYCKLKFNPSIFLNYKNEIVCVSV